MQGSTIGVTKGDTRSVDHGSNINEGAQFFLTPNYFAFLMGIPKWYP